MKWKIKNNLVEDEHGVIVCELTENASDLHKALIRYASDMFDAILDYNQSFENTTSPRNPKKHYDQFKMIEGKIIDEAE